MPHYWCSTYGIVFVPVSDVILTEINACMFYVLLHVHSKQMSRWDNHNFPRHNLH